MLTQTVTRLNVPGPKAQSVLTRDSGVVARAYGRVADLVMDYGRGSEVFDVDGNRYIDFVSGRIFGFIPTPALLILVVALITGLALAKSQYGRWIYLSGANEQTALISGIDIRRTKFSTYVLSGLMAGTTAIVLTAIVGASTTSMVRDERLMDVIAATVIGGASLKGGSGSVLGTMFGLLFITILGNVFNLLGVSPFIAMVIKGLVLVAVIGLDVLRSR